MNSYERATVVTLLIFGLVAQLREQFTTVPLFFIAAAVFQLGFFFKDWSEKK